jgi:purine nucleosidase
MFKRMKRAFKRFLIFAAVIIGIGTIIMSVIQLREFFKKDDVISIVIDSGEGNEADYLLAVVRAMYASEISIKAIITNQEHNFYEKSNKTDTLLSIAGQDNIPLLKGSSKSLQELEIPFNSEASDYLIREFKNLKRDEKLNIVCFGALTNVAALIQKDPSIAPYLRVYFQGARYDSRLDVWNKNEYNVRKDLDAFDVLLDTPNLELIILPYDLSKDFSFSREILTSLIQGKGKLWQFVSSELQNQKITSGSFSIKQVAIIEALINPRYSKVKEVMSPPENYKRQIKVYSFLNKTQMSFAFEQAIQKISR